MTDQQADSSRGAQLARERRIALHDDPHGRPVAKDRRRGLAETPDGVQVRRARGYRG
jgi:hypothetical protein